jgi:hypothetical protein
VTGQALSSSLKPSEGTTTITRSGLGESQLPKGKRLLLRISTGQVTLADSKNRLKPPKESHRKVGQTERLNREGHANVAVGVKNLPKAGDVKNDTAGL